MIIIERLKSNQSYQFWVFQFTFWLFWASFYLIFDFYIPIIFADAMFALLLTSGLRVFYQAVWEKPFLVRFLSILLGSAITGLFWNVFKRHMELLWQGEETIKLFEKLGYVDYYTHQFLGLSFWVILSWSGLYLGLTFYHLLQEERAKSLSIRAMAHEAQLRMLRYQLNPHFLFNTLNAISTLVLESDTKTANTMITKLSKFLRYSLDMDSLQKVDLDREMNTTKLYLEIEQVRFEERLRVDFNVQDKARNALIPSMLLQPLVENSIKYAVAEKEEGAKIQINAEVHSDNLLIEVQDDGPGIKIENGTLPEFRGVGINNMRSRLEKFYGSAHSCQISQAVPHGLKIEIRIPFEVKSQE